MRQRTRHTYSLRMAAYRICSTVILAAACVSSLHAQEEIDFFGLTLEQLINTQVVTATGRKQSMKTAPALIAAISAEDIAFWHYRSVAEAIQSIPGIYCIDDHLSPNCGVRGVSGGFRGYSKIVKVMIDGQPTGFRSDSNNYLGPEFIPMTAVERIEVLKGPASALYGANAFLGVINIITRHIDNTPKGFVNYRHNSNGDSFEGHYRGQHGNTALLLAITGGTLDRSGQEVPDTVPWRSLFDTSDRSENDTAQPLAVFAKAHWTLASHALSVSSHFSRLDSKAQFVDFGRFAETGDLGTDVRVALESWTLAVDDQWQLNDTFSSHFRLGYAEGEPSSHEHLDLGLSNTFVEREFGYQTVDSLAELVWRLAPQHALTMGIDHSADNEKLFESSFVDRSTGTVTHNGFEQGHKTLYNTGYYLQYTGFVLSSPGSSLEITANARNDHHNIYGDDNNYRLGLVYEKNSAMTFKLVHATSYKAPAALQLYGQPLFDGEVGSNPDLKTESAHSTEAQFVWQISQAISFTLGAYRTDVDDKVELERRRASQQPINRSAQQSRGIETQLRWFNGLNKLTLNAAVQDSEINSFDILGRPMDQPAELYPEQIFDLYFTRKLNETAGLGLHWRAVSPRRASTSNIALNGTRPYQLDSYQLLNAVFNIRFENTHLGLRIDNLLDEVYVEPGFSGIDIPGQPRTTLFDLVFDW